MTLQTEIKDYVIEFRSDNRDGSPRPSIYVTQRTALMLKDQAKKATVKHIDIHDSNGNFVEMIETRLIKNIRKAGGEARGGISRFAVCDYGTRHAHLGKKGFETCECEKKYLLNPFAFFKLAHRLHGVEYPSDITKEIQEDLLKIIEFRLKKIKHGG